MTCYECGRKLRDSAVYCPSCGALQLFTEELLAQAMDNDQDALGQLYKMTYNNVYMTVRMLVQDEDARLDLVQDTFLRAFNHLDRLGRPEAFRGWVKRIAHNLAVDYLRKKQPVVFSSMTTEDTGEEIDFADERPMSMPEEILDAQETTRLLDEILKTLPEEQQAVVAMFYYEQLPVKRIAEILGVSENTVKSRLLYARKKIEASVLELEKQGTKLYGLSPIPFLLYLLKSADSQKMLVPDGQILQNVCRGHDRFLARQSARADRPDGGDAGKGSRSGRGGARPAEAGGRSARAAGHGTKAGAAARGTARTAAGAAGKSALAKVVIGVLAAAIVAGGATLGVLVYKNYIQDAGPAGGTADAVISANAADQQTALDDAASGDAAAAGGQQVQAGDQTLAQTQDQAQDQAQPQQQAETQPVPVTDGDRIVLQGTVGVYTAGEILTMQGRQDILNSGYPTDETVWAITLDQPEMVTGRQAGESGITGEATMIGLAEGAGLESYDGQHVVFSIDPDTTWWPTDVSMPVDQPRTDDVHILRVGGAADAVQAASEVGPAELTVENYAGEYVCCSWSNYHMYIESDGAGGWQIRFLETRDGAAVNEVSSPVRLEDGRFLFSYYGNDGYAVDPLPDGTIERPGNMEFCGHYVPVTNPPDRAATLEDYLGSYSNGTDSLTLRMDGDTLCCTANAYEFRYAGYEIWEDGTLYIYNSPEEEQWPDPYFFVLLQDGSLDAVQSGIRESGASQGLYRPEAG